MLALISFSPADPGWSQTAWQEPIHNWGGEVGAYLSDFLRQFFGYVAYAIPILIIILSLQIRVNIRIEKPIITLAYLSERSVLWPLFSVQQVILL